MLMTFLLKILKPNNNNYVIKIIIDGITSIFQRFKAELLKFITKLQWILAFVPFQIDNCYSQWSSGALWRKELHSSQMKAPKKKNENTQIKCYEWKLRYSLHRKQNVMQLWQELQNPIFKSGSILDRIV